MGREAEGRGWECDCGSGEEQKRGIKKRGFAWSRGHLCILTAPPISPTNPCPNHPATSPPPPQTPPPPCGMPFVRGERRILAPLNHRRTYTVTHTHTQTRTHTHTHTSPTSAAAVLLCLCETTIVSPSYTSHQGILHIIMNDIYIERERARERMCRC